MAADSPFELDKYGGWKKIQTRATGFFRVEKTSGRWWFMTPEGHGLISAGVNHVDYKLDYSPEFVRFVVRHLKDWGFNTIGWSQESMAAKFEKGNVPHSPGWGPEQYRRLDMPYMHLIRFTDMEWYANEEFPDVFSDAFAEKCERLAREVCPALKDDPNLIGWFYSDAPNFPKWIEEAGRDRFPAIARRYYEVIAGAIRRYDPNHLILGDRYKADGEIPNPSGKSHGLPDVVLEAMKDTVDVLSMEYYRPGDEMESRLAEWHAKTGKPVFLADSAFHAPTDVLKVGPGGPTYVPDQAARGDAYRRFARRAYSNPLVIGWHWCAFGRSVGRKSGLLDGEDKPYEDCVSRMREFNRRELYAVAAGNG